MCIMWNLSRRCEFCAKWRAFCCAQGTWRNNFHFKRQRMMSRDKRVCACHRLVTKPRKHSQNASSRCAEIKSRKASRCASCCVKLHFSWIFSCKRVCLHYPVSNIKPLRMATKAKITQKKTFTRCADEFPTTRRWHTKKNGGDDEKNILEICAFHKETKIKAT
jgi:hypothetical protein